MVEAAWQSPRGTLFTNIRMIPSGATAARNSMLAQQVRAEGSDQLLQIFRPAYP
jgi:hypothetical protein